MADPTPPGVRFCDLGPLSIERDGVVEPVRGRRVSAALALLLVRANQHVSADALVDAIWGDAPSEGASVTLGSHMWRLRKFLEPDRRRGEPFTTIIHDGTGFRLAVTEEQVDSLLFDKLAGEARDLLVTDQAHRAVARCDEALGSWRGQPWSPHSDEPWAMATSSRLREIHDQIREHRLQGLLQVGDLPSVLADVEPLLAQTPLRERLWAVAMLAAYRADRVDQALDTFRRARHTLIEETGLEPGAELRELHAKILSRDPDLDPPRTGTTSHDPAQPVEVHLPHRRTELLGRTTEREQLVRAVTAMPLVTIVGSAGCGKTRLSIDVARHAAPAFPDGVWFVDLTAAGNSSQLTDVLSSTLGLAAPPVGTVTEGLRAFTRNRRMLIVLDNCEHLLDEVADLTDTLLGSQSELTVLATSREPLDLDDEHLWHLQPLPTRATDRAGSDDSAVQLFLQRLVAARPDVNPGPDEVELAAEICASVDGLPLAIELAAGQARSFTLDEIADRVRSDPANLSRIGRGGNRHHATLRGTIELSTATLDRVELTVHTAVAVVPGPFTTELAAHLADISPSQAATALAGLVHRSLLTPLGAGYAGGPSRFSQLATVRAHGLNAAPNDRENVISRRDRWVGDLIGAIPDVGSSAELRWHTKVDDNYAAVRATLHHCLEVKPHPIGAAITGRLGLYWFYRGMAVEWRRWASLARQSDVADPYDQLLVGASFAGIASLVEGAELYERWLDELDASTVPLSYEQTVWLAQYLPAVCITTWLTGAMEVCQRAARKLRDIADETHHPLLDLFATFADVLTRSQSGDPTVLAALDDCYHRAQAADNFYARWATAAAGMAAGLTVQAPEIGLRWSDLQMQEFDKFGFEVNVSALEARGTLLLMTGRPYDAIRTLARSRFLGRRIGLRWPSMPSTPDILAAAENQLPIADRERAYREGTLHTRAVAGEHAAGLDASSN